MPPRDPEAETMRFAFRELVRGLRRQKGLTVSQLASKLNLPEPEIAALERSLTCRIKPLVLHKLSEFFGIPQRTMAVLAGAVKDAPLEVREQASRFAAKSDSFAKLTSEEKRVLDEFVKALKADA
jgi:transcriptional regulator with XRE-family HTH domain